ncbi:MAG: TlpA disulfide reductase family protein [Bacteroidota bacterium]|nr:TlpA disulfide reductase family protein [Bacteroidota bacterium]
MIKYLIKVILFFNLGIAYSQNIEIEVKNFEQNKAYLASLSGGKIIPCDTIKSSSEGVFQFNINTAKHHTGIYRLTFEKNKWLDFVNDGEDISITTDANNILDSLQVIKSESNQLYYTFIKLNKVYKSKSDLLQLILARYPKDDDYYMTTQKKITQLQKEYSEFVNVTYQKNPNSFIARYIKSSQLPVIDEDIPLEKHVSYLKSHSLDFVDFNDAGLINSDVFSNKSIEYLTYYRNPQLPKELLEKEFMIAVDTILQKAKVNPMVYKHVVEYLLDGFKKFGFDAIINYIIENYVIKDDVCIDQKLETALQRRMDQAKHFKIGDTVPNIVSKDLSGKEVELYRVTSENILILFYASWCPHCQTLLLQIGELYKNQNQKKVEVFALSIDTSKTDWQKFVDANGWKWINVSDLRGWGGSAVKDYYIYATPTMFLIDKRRKIILKPLSLDELVRVCF